MRRGLWLGMSILLGCVDPGSHSGVSDGGEAQAPVPVTTVLASGPDLGARCRGSAFDLPHREAVCSPQTTCQANRAPVLGRPWFMVEGRLQRQLLEADLVDGGVFLVVPYSDQDCNLGCGRFEERFNDPFGDGGDRGELSDAIGCGSPSEDHCLTMWLYFDSAQEGPYPFEFQVSDACGEPSNTISGRITIPPRP